MRTYVSEDGRTLEEIFDEIMQHPEWWLHYEGITVIHTDGTTEILK